MKPGHSSLVRIINKRIERRKLPVRRRDQWVTRSVVSRIYSASKHERRFQNFAGAHAFVADLNIPAGEESVALRVVPVVNVEATENGLSRLLTEQFFIPGLLKFGRGQSHVLVIGLELNADIDTFIADVSGIALKQSGDLSFSETAERAAQNLMGIA